jgi:uncharacterized protein YjbI with pentapeptide repeats
MEQITRSPSSVLSLQNFCTFQFIDRNNITAESITKFYQELGNDVATSILSRLPLQQRLSLPMLPTACQDYLDLAIGEKVKLFSICAHLGKGISLDEAFPSLCNKFLSSKATSEDLKKLEADCIELMEIARSKEVRGSCFVDLIQASQNAQIPETTRGSLLGEMKTLNDEFAFREVNLEGKVLCGINFSGLHLEGAQLQGANLYQAILSGAKLNHADLSDAILIEANLDGAILCGANLSSADLSKASLNGADVSDANLYRANLSRVNLSNVDMTFVVYQKRYHGPY